MAIVDVVDWKIFLSPNSDIPPDVNFLVSDGEDKNSWKTIRARWRAISAGFVLRVRVASFDCDGVRVRTGTSALRFSLFVVWIAFDGQASSPSG